MTSSQQLSDRQQIVLNMVPIPSALISILGSTAVIHLACQKRKVKPWTPYTRLLVAMSVCDIAFSSAIAIATFLRPSETSDRVWAFGNDTTCHFIAFMIQATAAGFLYQGMLSIYFLLTTRYGMKNERIARLIEPIMHFLALGYAIGTAILGAAMGIYGEKTGGGSCWVVRFYDGSVSDAEKIKRDVLLYFFMPVPVLTVTVCLICTQTSIYFFVRRHTKKSLSQGNDESLSSNGDTAARGGSDRTRPIVDSAQSFRNSSKTKSKGERQSKQKIASVPSRNQSQRLQLLCSQAFLHVFSFLLCQTCNLITAALQNQAGSREGELEMMAKYYPLTVLQAILLPIQGLFNFLIYVRPRYLILRLDFPGEGRLWTVKRIVLCENLPPAHGRDSRVVTPGDTAADRKHVELKSDPEAPIADSETSKSAMVSTPLPRNLISSLTASDGDFDSVVDALREDDRWQGASNHVQQSTLARLASGVNRLTDLEEISEMSDSIFELTPYQLNGSHHSNSFSLPIPNGQSEGRWRDAETAPTLGKTPESSSEERFEPGVGTEQRRPSGIDSKPPKVSDVPIRVPTRTSDAQDDFKGRANLNIGEKAKEVADVPLSLPQRFRSLPQDYFIGQANSNIGQRAKQVADVPLPLPQRFNSLPPSEIEDA